MGFLWGRSGPAIRSRDKKQGWSRGSLQALVLSAGEAGQVHRRWNEDVQEGAPDWLCLAPPRLSSPEGIRSLLGTEAEKGVSGAHPFLSQGNRSGVSKKQAGRGLRRLRLR